MGTDVTYGTLWGLPLSDVLKPTEPTFETVTRYDTFTGEPQQFQQRVYRSHVLKPIGKFVAGQVVDDIDVENYFEEIKEEYSNSNCRFYHTYNYFGFKSFGDEPPYIRVQDSCREYVDISEEARSLWEKEFPGLTGKNLLFLYVSC